ncbi:MAG TPA: hypothetical protein VM100_10920, partial [Longimicrobiales bacterium]|nr:hypothetical protein [Longimicrobiales bacterium]
VRQILADAGVSRTFSTAVTSEFDYLKTPLIERKTPGTEFGVNPRDYKLRDVADAYVMLK